MNTTVAFAAQAAAILMGFFTRVIFTRTLSEGYVGINGLFTDILNILSLSELGVGTAITYALYGPIAKKDIEKQQILMRMFRTFYRMTAAFVLTAGLCLIPFLNVLMKDRPDVDHLVLIYLLYLLNSVVSYLLIYKKTLVDAHQMNYITVLYNNGFLVMQDILNADHPTKVEEHERYMLVVAKFFRGGEEMQVCLVQGADFVLSFIESESPLFDDIPQAIRNNVLKFRSRPSDYLLSVLLNSITANYATLISKLDGDLDDLETGLLSTTDCRDTGGQIQELRHRYLQLKQAALPLRDQYAKLLHSDSALLHKNVRPFFNDVNDHLQYVVQQIDLCRETLSSLVDLYISNNDLRMNAIMKRLTIVSTLFIPLTFLVGVWGMNFKIMPELDWRYGYFIAWAVMIVTGVLTWLYMKRKDWY